MKWREERIAEKRQQQTLEELERKCSKSSGRHSKRYWTVEQVDLIRMRAKLLVSHLKPRPLAE